MLRDCKTYRRAYGQSMPQPKPGNGGGDVDVVVRGLIGGMAEFTMPLYRFQNAQT